MMKLREAKRNVGKLFQPFSQYSPAAKGRLDIFKYFVEIFQ